MPDIFYHIFLAGFNAPVFFPFLQRRLEILSKEKEELSKENQALSKQLEELKQGIKT